MTEEDTFNRLKRTPFRELFISVLDPVLVGDDIIPNRSKPRVEAAGWNFEEFRKVALNELELGSLTASVTDLTDPKWREVYLSLPIIY